MQRAAFAAAGLEWTYELMDVPAEDLVDAVRKLREPEFVGANVTIPHKVAVMALLDAVEGEASAAGAVNTLRREDSRLVGTNTDIAGISAAVAAVGVEPEGASALILGAGGSARAAAIALGGSRLTFVARRPTAGAGLPGKVLSWSDPSWLALARRCDVLLNATPLGRHGEMPLHPAALPPGGAVIDLVYAAGGTPLVRRARQVGLRVADGWSVLLAQGAASFQAWSGRPAPLAAMRRALEEAGA